MSHPPETTGLPPKAALSLAVRTAITVSMLFMAAMLVFGTPPYRPPSTAIDREGRPIRVIRTPTPDTVVLTVEGRMIAMGDPHPYQPEPAVN